MNEMTAPTADDPRHVRLRSAGDYLVSLKQRFDADALRVRQEAQDTLAAMRAGFEADITPLVAEIAALEAELSPPAPPKKRWQRGKKALK